MIVYKNGVKYYEALVSQTDSIAFNAVDTVMDVDGNVYRTIKIGNKLWTIDNLRTTKLNDGTPIPNITTDNIKFADGVSGVLRTTPALSWHNNLSYNKFVFGGLYNWYALETNKLAPKGWRVATKEDWSELENYLAANGYNFDDTKSTDGSVTKIIKALASDNYWNSSTPNGSVGNDIKANNKSGLAILPSGFRDGMNWGVTGDAAGYWTASMYDNSLANSRNFGVADTGIVQTRTDAKQMAYSVRCVKDIVTALVAGAVPDSHLSGLISSFATRRDAAIEALRYNALVVAPLDYTYQTSTGCPLSRAFSYSLADYAFKSLWLNANVDKANAALVQNADFYLTNPTYLKDRDSFYWSSDEWTRLLEFYGSNGTKTKGLITAETEAKLFELMFLYLKTWAPAAYTSLNPVPYAEYAVSNTWNVDGSENHHVMQFCTFWHFAKLLKDHPTYASQTFPDGTTSAQIYTVTTEYIKHYIVERAKKGLFVEMANDSYHVETLKGFYNCYDFSPDSELKELSGKLLDLYWGLWAQEQISGVRGGGKARVYRGTESFIGATAFYNMAYYYLGINSAATISGTQFTFVSSNYRMPYVVMDMALMKAERGNYELEERPLGLANGTYYGAPNYRLKQDYGGIVRYSYCTPDFVMGSIHSEARKYEDWTMISSQNRWVGVIFDGDAEARIFPQAQSDYRAYNQYGGVQSKGCMVVQTLPLGVYSKMTDSMRVCFGAKGLSTRVERGGWVFTSSNGAYAAIKVVSGTYKNITFWTRPAIVCTEQYSPVIIEVAQKKNFTSYTDFQDKIIALPLTYDGKVLTHKTIYGDNLTYYADRTSLPKVNSQLIDLRPTNVFDSPFIKSAYNSGVVEISKNTRKLVLDFTLK